MAPAQISQRVMYASILKPADLCYLTASCRPASGNLAQSVSTDGLCFHKLFLHLFMIGFMDVEWNDSYRCIYASDRRLSNPKMIVFLCFSYNPLASSSLKIGFNML